MRRYCVAGLLLLAAIAQEGCIFEPRTPETPGGGTGECIWITTNRPKDVFINLKCGLASNLDSNYERSLDAAFTFVPSADAEAIYPGGFADWTKGVELDFLARIKTLYLGERSVQFGDANMTFTYENEQVSLATYEGTYTITLNVGDASPRGLCGDSQIHDRPGHAGLGALQMGGYPAERRAPNLGHSEGCSAPIARTALHKATRNQTYRRKMRS